MKASETSIAASSKVTGGGTTHLRSDPTPRSNDNKKSRMLPLWPEWNEADVNAESWDIAGSKKKEPGGSKARAEVKSATSMMTHGFEDPEGKVELPASLKVEQWKRPIDFLSSDKPPVIVDADHGMQNFDLMTPNEHLHYNETMRNIVSQITALWDVCRRERKHTATGTSDTHSESNLAVIHGRTWRPWEHIYALSKVSRQPFIPPYNPAGKYVVRLFFLGTWRKIIVDDSVPFDAKHRCLLPQTSIPNELWPILLSKALLKIVSLDFSSSNASREHNETTIIHSLTGWLPEPIPLKYNHAEKVWNFLRYDRSNKHAAENESDKHKSDQHPLTPSQAFGPVPLFKWPDTKIDLPEESAPPNDPTVHHDDSATEIATKKSDDRSVKKVAAPNSLTVPKDPMVAGKSPGGKETRGGGGSTTGGGKEARKLGGAGRGATTDESAALADDQTMPDAPKMIVFVTIPHVPATRLSSYSETADRSERLRRYNLNDTFSTSMLLTSIRDIPLEPPPPPEFVPPWKLIRPKKPKVLPSAEPVAPQEPKHDRWIEIASPYINYPTATALRIKPTIRLHLIDSCMMSATTPAHGPTSHLTRSATRSTIVDVPDILEVDEEADIEHGDGKTDVGSDYAQGGSTAHTVKKDELNTHQKEIHLVDTPDAWDESQRNSSIKMKPGKSTDKNKINRKLAGSKLELSGGGGKAPSDAVSVKSRAGESEHPHTPMDSHPTGHSTEHPDSQPKSNEVHSNPTLMQPVKKLYTTPKIWMDFDDFCSCFTSIVVFHNPRAYHYTHKHTDIKLFTPPQPVVTSVTKEKKKDANPAVVPQIPNLQDEKSPLYIFVDSTRETMEKNIELIVGLTSLSRWHDAPVNDAGGPGGPILPASLEKGSRGVGAASTDRTPADLSPARGLGGRQRTSIYEAVPPAVGTQAAQHEGANPEVPQKEVLILPGSLIAEIYSWKALSMGQPILRLHTTATKAALLTLPPGRHVLKLTVVCPLASHLQILSDTNDFTLGDEDQLLARVISVPEDAEFIARAEELFYALDDAVQNFNHSDLQNRKLIDLFLLYCHYAPERIHLSVPACWAAFYQALYATLRTIYHGSGSAMSSDIQFAWRCFTNDLGTPDILGVHDAKRPGTSSTGRHSARGAPVLLGPNGPVATPSAPSVTGKKGGAGKERAGDDKAAGKQQSQVPVSSSITDVQEEPVSEWLTRDLTFREIEAVINVQKCARGFLQRRIRLARTPGTEKNAQIQRALQLTMTHLRADAARSASALFRNLMTRKSQLIQCFQFRNDDWNMVTYKDYHGQYQEQAAHTWFAIFREIFHVGKESLLSAKLLTHSQNSLLRVINNDTYEELFLVFNRLAPAMLTKNKLGYTFLAESMSLDQPIPPGRFRLRLLTSYTSLPEPRMDQITSSFLAKEIKDYYVPNKQQVICRYRVTVADDVHQTGRNFHLTSIRFSTSKSDVLMRLSVLNNNEEVTSVEGKGIVVLPAFLFMRNVTHASNHAAQASAAAPAPLAPTAPSSIAAAPPASRPTSKTGGTIKKDATRAGGAGGHRGSIVESTAMGSGRSDKEKSGSGKRSLNSKKKSLRRSSSRTGIVIEGEEKFYKYIIQVTLLRKSWPLTPTQWQFVEQLKEQEQNDLKIFNHPSTSKLDGTAGGGPGVKRAGANASSTAGKAKGTTAAAGTNKSGTTASGRPGTGKGHGDRPIDPSKAYWTLRVISDADKADEVTIKKDTERHDELINMKKAWETFETGRAQKARMTRQKFLESLEPKAEEKPLADAVDGVGKGSDGHAGDEKSHTTTEQHHGAKQNVAGTLKKSTSSTGNKKGTTKEDASKQAELAAAQHELIPLPLVDEPLLDEPPLSKPKIILPPLDTKPFTKQKLHTDEQIILDPLFEQEELRRRQAEFTEYDKYSKEIRRSREEDQHNRYKEKIRQLEEYIDLQGKVDQSRRTINEPREAFRQRFLEVERKRLAELAAQEQELIAMAEKAKAAAAVPAKRKTSPGKKGKK